MNVVVDFNVKGMKDVPGCCTVYFYYENGDKVYDNNNRALCVSFNITPRYKNAYYTDFTFFIPYSSFNIPQGNSKLKCFCAVHQVVNSSYVQVLTSKWAYFSLTRG